MRYKVLRIRFQEQEFVLTDNELCGPIATPAAYVLGLASYAHLYPDGQIYRFGKLIGTKDDIEVLGPGYVDVDDPVGSLANMMTDPSWERPCESD